MSVLEDLRSIEDRLTSRLNELRPLVEEYRELERAAQRLGIDTSAPKTPRRRASANGAKRRKPAGASRQRRRRSASGRPSRRDQVLALVKERPGITVPEIGTALKVDPTGLYRVVHGLESEGAIKKDGKAIQPA
jgi:hypothetical protein